MMNLRKRSIGETEKCPCYGKEVESTVHSIIRCDVAKRVWDCWDFQFGEIGQELFDVSEAALQIWDKRSVRDLELFFVVAWSIWHNRNFVVFESVCSLPNHI